MRHHRRAQRLLKAVGHVASFDSIRTEAAAIMQRLTQALKVRHLVTTPCSAARLTQALKAERPCSTRYLCAHAPLSIPPGAARRPCCLRTPRYLSPQVQLDDPALAASELGSSTRLLLLLDGHEVRYYGYTSYTSYTYYTCSSSTGTRRAA